MTQFSLLMFATAAILAGAPISHALALPPGAGQDLVAKACTQCHDETMVTSQHFTAPQWADTVRQMISNGASVAPRDFDKIVAYLAKNFGAPPQPATLVSRSKNDVPYYPSVTWQMVE